MVYGTTTLLCFTYDAAGNVTDDDRSGTVYHYRYNNRGRLDELTIGATVAADYTYDALERMAIRAVASQAATTHYLYDLDGRLLAEADDAGATLREYIWLDDMPLAVVADVNTASPNLYFVHADHLNRPIKMTDGSQSVVWDAIYRPFGEVYSITGSATNISASPANISCSSRASPTTGTATTTRRSAAICSLTPPFLSATSLAPKPLRTSHSQAPEMLPF